MTLQPGPIPEAGDLAEGSLPRLLLALYRERFEGSLTLTRGRSEKSFRFHKGAPVSAESNMRSETLGVQLIDKGLLTSEQYEEVSAYMQRKKCREGVALLALELIAPKDLFNALKDQVRRRLQEVFAWPSGTFEISPGEVATDDVQVFRCDPIALVQEGIEIHWGPERILNDLTRRVVGYPVPRKSFAKVRARLRSDETVDSLLARLDGKQSFGQAIGPALSSPLALSAAWVLDAADALEFRQEPVMDDVAGAARRFDAEIELDIDDAPSGEARVARATPGPARKATNSSAGSDAAASLRAEIEKQQSGLDDRSHYQRLGVEENATTGTIKKAYFKAAKLYHPDTLAKLDLNDLREQAADVFAAIAEAFEVLSDKQKRKDYDAGLRGELTETQARLLAQAETSYRKGEILLKMGDFAGAIEYLQPAVDAWPDEAAYQCALGWALYKQPASDVPAARACLEKAVRLTPEDALVHFRLGMVLRAVGETERANQALARARQIDPSVE
jgi:tetratricopeptide (TPR) repeat protein